MAERPEGSLQVWWHRQGRWGKDVAEGVDVFSKMSARSRYGAELRAGSHSVRIMEKRGRAWVEVTREVCDG